MNSTYFKFVVFVLFITIKCVYNRDRKLEDRNYRAQYIQHILNKQSLSEAKLKLIGGKNQFEGNVYIYHAGRWGAICDHTWDDYAARVVCRTFNRTGLATHNSMFGQPVNNFWLSDVVCQGDEIHLALCTFSHWGGDNCELTNAAGVKCFDGETPPKLRRKKVVRRLMERLGPDAQLRLVGGSVVNEGRVEVYFDEEWSSLCPDQWTAYEANVVCKHLGYGYAAQVLQTNVFKVSSIKLAGVRCVGNETNFFNCMHEEFGFKGCLGARGKVAAVVCDMFLPDLRVDYYAIEASAHLVDVPLYQLRCAMEESCLSKSAYEIQHKKEDWQFETRRLLRFTASSINVGNADFRPYLPKHMWQWHLCHLHYHSMEVFATFDVLDRFGRKVAQGHKASFCLEDNLCRAGVEKKYSCSNFGDQGISVNCSDIYHYSLDCQWVDVTDVIPGYYVFKMSVNPHIRISEQSYHNNAAVCILSLTQSAAKIYDCVLDRP